MSSRPPEESPPAEARAASAGSAGDFEVLPSLHDDLAASVHAVLQQPQPSIPVRFLYDALGSHLFNAITEVDEYYLTRTEAALFEAHRAEFAKVRPTAGCTMIDLGAGNCAKAAKLFDTVQPAHYVAVDVAAEFLEEALSQLRHKFPKIDMTGVGADFSERLELPPGIPDGQRLFFYPGSSIGNFSRDGAVVFLRSVREAMGPDGALWITTDFDKDPAILERAYDDELGVTAAFNRNVLKHCNRVAKTDFAVSDWQHIAVYNRTEMRIEMYLETVRDVTVRWPGGERRFKKGQRLHTENSHKSTIKRFTELLSLAGLEAAAHWTDERGWMGFFVAVPA